MQKFPVARTGSACKIGQNSTATPPETIVIPELRLEAADVADISVSVAVSIASARPVSPAFAQLDKETVHVRSQQSAGLATT